MIEIVRFLASHAPFAGLPEERLQAIASSLQVEFFAAGTTILHEGGSPSSFVYMLRKGRVEMQTGGTAFDLLEEGELFGFPSLLSGESPAFDVTVSEDAICYLFDRSVATEVFSAPSGVAFLTLRLRDRHLQARQTDDWRPGVELVGAIARSRLVTVDADRPIDEVAQLMTTAGASAVVVELAEGLGIATDRDFRARAVAGGTAPDRPIADICTIPARTIEAATLADDALLEMLDLGIHHLPVTESGRLVGMLTDLDLLGLERRDAFRLRSEMHRAADFATLARAGRRIPDAIVAVAEGGADAEHVCRVTAVLTDGLTARALELAWEELGPPPCRWAWLGLGSAGRREQALSASQDHGLVYEEGGEAHDSFFAEMAGLVVRILEQAGIPRSRSGVLASEKAWRGSVRWWLDRLGDWVSKPERSAAYITGIAFDYRRVAGNLDVIAPFDEAVSEIRHDPDFLHRLGQIAVGLKVPIGFLGHLVVHDEGDHSEVVDVKQGGILPVTEMARLLALEAGALTVGTIARLRAAAAGGTVDEQSASALIEAFTLFGRVRLRSQIEQHRSGEPFDDLVEPASLGQLERSALRDAFRLVGDVQGVIRERYGAGVRGL